MTATIFKSPTRFKTVMNLWPPYWGTGISVAAVSPDFMHLTVQMKKRFYNSNAFGTHFGGAGCGRLVRAGDSYRFVP